MVYNLRPLTPTERQVAEKHCSIIDRFLTKQHLPADDWYDVVVFAYLRAVERWFREPKLYAYSFTTIAWQAMFSTYTQKLRAQRHQIQTVSLYDIIPGTDDLTYADIITEDNLDYTPYT